MACLHDHSCEDHNCSSDWSLYKLVIWIKELFIKCVCGKTNPARAVQCRLLHRRLRRPIRTSELVTGGAACVVPDSSSSSANPLGAISNAIIGSSSKTQDRLREIPTSTTTPYDGGGVYVGTHDPLAALPGSELDHSLQPNGSEFLQGFRTSDQNRFAHAWEEIQRPQIPVANFPLEHTRLQPFEWPTSRSIV